MKVKFSKHGNNDNIYFTIAITILKWFIFINNFLNNQKCPTVTWLDWWAHDPVILVSCSQTHKTDPSCKTHSLTSQETDQTCKHPPHLYCNSAAIAPHWNVRINHVACGSLLASLPASYVGISNQSRRRWHRAGRCTRPPHIPRDRWWRHGHRMRAYCDVSLLVRPLSRSTGFLWLCCVVIRASVHFLQGEKYEMHFFKFN